MRYVSTVAVRESLTRHYQEIDEIIAAEVAKKTQEMRCRAEQAEGRNRSLLMDLETAKTNAAYRDRILDAMEERGEIVRWANDLEEGDVVIMLRGYPLDNGRYDRSYRDCLMQVVSVSGPKVSVKFLTNRSPWHAGRTVCLDTNDWKLGKVEQHQDKLREMFSAA